MTGTDPPQKVEPGTGVPASVVRKAVAWWTNFTAGQQWTAGLLVLVAATVVSFGLPTASRVVPDTAAASPGKRDVPGAPASAAESPENRDAADDDTFSGGNAGASFPVLGDRSPPRPPTAVPDPPRVADPTSPERPDVVLVVRREGLIPGRDDADIAAAYLARARFDAEVVELGGASSCDEIAAAGQVVVSGAGLPAELRDCLVQRGKILIAHDALGGVPPTPGRGQILSTRRSSVSSLLDLAGWARSAGELPARIGLVSSESLRDEVEPAVSALARTGVTFEAAFFVEDGPTNTLDILDALGEFSDAGIETVVLAARVEHQRRWVELESVSGATFDHLVSDLADGVVVEDYPSSFAGALAHTSLRFPWFEREEGATAQQERCREEWEAAAPPGPSGGAAETALAFTWCLHLWHVVEPALDAVDAGTPFTAALRAQVVPSPITSQLQTLGDGTYGPAQDYLLEWDGDCSCWAFREETLRQTD